MYQVLARKWRPQGFDELVGQDHVARTLRNSIAADRLAHAYIFAGLRGTGKTTVARIFAKCLNCEKGPTPTPCGTCDPCREITEGRAIDVLEMDAASRTGVDDIRELQEVVSYAPVRDRFKVLIIDEAHMLSKQAFNALLKTLEEPPPRVMFVLATTELQKILPTILSRCQLFEFRRVTPRELSAHLRTVCEAEGVRVSDAVLDRIARAGEGSVRDSLSLLERVVAFGGAAVSEEDAMYVLGTVRTEAIAEMLRAMSARDPAVMLTVLDDLAAEGHDLLHLWAEIIGTLRDLMLLRTLPERSDLLSRSAEETRSLATAAEGLSREDLTRAFQILAELEPALKGSSQPRFLFETALIRLADLGSVRSIEEILGSLATGDVPPTPTRGAVQPGQSSASSTSHQKKNLPADRTVPLSEDAPTPAPLPMASPIDGAASQARVPSAADDRVLRVRELLHQRAPMLDAMLSQAESIRLGHDGLEVSFAPRRDPVRRQVERPDNLSKLSEAAEQALGERVRVKVVSAPAPDRPGAVPARARTSSAPGTKPAHERNEEPSLRRARGGAASGAAAGLLESARNEPGVAKLLDEFGAQVLDIQGTHAPRDLVDPEEAQDPAEEMP